jgi:hypothetical protein
VAENPDAWYGQYGSTWGESTFGTHGIYLTSTLGNGTFVDTLAQHLVPPELIGLYEIKSAKNATDLAAGMFDSLRADNWKWCLDANCNVNFVLDHDSIVHIYRTIDSGGDISDEGFCRLIRGMGVESFRVRGWKKVKQLFGLGGPVVDAECTPDVMVGPNTRAFAVAPGLTAELRKVRKLVAELTALKSQHQRQINEYNVRYQSWCQRIAN